MRLESNDLANELADIGPTVDFAGAREGRSDPRAAWRIGVICALAALGTLATNIFLPSLPEMAADLGVSSAAMTSSISLFLAIFAAGQLVVGPLSDRVGRRVPVLAGLVLFVLGAAWCARAHDLTGLLAGRAIQAVGACAASVLARAIAADLFEGQALAKVMAAITIATAAAPGFSPLLGSGLANAFGWRSEFAFVAVFAVGALLAYATLLGETNRSSVRRSDPLAVGRVYVELLRDRRFIAPARSAGLLMAGLFAVFSATPRVLLEHFGFSPVALGFMFAGVVVLVLCASISAPRLAAKLGAYRATLLGLGVSVAGAAALLAAVLMAYGAFPPFLLAVALFVLGVGVASPLCSTMALSPFATQAGSAAALFGFVQMVGAACGTALAAAVSRDPGMGLATVLALACPLAALFFARDGRSARPVRIPH